MYECYLICYDITAPRRLRKVAILMQAHGARVQKSVFECWLTPREMVLLLERASAVLEPRYDSVRVYHLCRRCTGGRRVLGKGELIEAPRSVFV